LDAAPDAQCTPLAYTGVILKDFSAGEPALSEIEGTSRALARLPTQRVYPLRARSFASSG